MKIKQILLSILFFSIGLQARPTNLRVLTNPTDGRIDIFIDDYHERGADDEKSRKELCQLLTTLQKEGVCCVVEDSYALLPIVSQDRIVIDQFIQNLSAYLRQHTTIARTYNAECRIVNPHASIQDTLQQTFDTIERVKKYNAPQFTPYFARCIARLEKNLEIWKRIIGIMQKKAAEENLEWSNEESWHAFEEGLTDNTTMKKIIENSVHYSDRKMYIPKIPRFWTGDLVDMSALYFRNQAKQKYTVYVLGEMHNDTIIECLKQHGSKITYSFKDADIVKDNFDISEISIVNAFNRYKNSLTRFSWFKNNKTILLAGATLLAGCALFYTYYKTAATKNL